MNETHHTETNTGEIARDAHAEGMNVMIMRDFSGAMVVCAERFTYAEDGWHTDDLTVAEITNLSGMHTPMTIVMRNDVANTAGPRLLFSRSQVSI